MILSRPHNVSPVIPINYWRNCHEVVWWHWYIWSDISFQDNFCEALRFVSRAASQIFVSIGCNGKYSIINWFFGDAFGVLSRQFFSTVLQCGAWLQILTLKLLYSAVSGSRFLTVGVFQCCIARRRSVAVLCMLYKIRFNPMHPLYVALPVSHVQVAVTCGAFMARRYTYIYLLAAEHCSTLSFHFPSQCICGTILLTLYSKVWDWRVSRVSQCVFIGLATRSRFCLLLFSLSLLSFYRLVLWCWCLWTDKV